MPKLTSQASCGIGRAGDGHPGCRALNEVRVEVQDMVEEGLQATTQHLALLVAHQKLKQVWLDVYHSSWREWDVSCVRRIWQQDKGQAVRVQLPVHRSP